MYNMNNTPSSASVSGDDSLQNDSSRNIINYINLFDRGDRLGANLSWYISTILVAIKNKYEIRLIKPKTNYKYYNSIFVESLFHFIEEYNEIFFKRRNESNAPEENIYIEQSDDWFTPLKI